MSDKKMSEVKLEYENYMSVFSHNIKHDVENEDNHQFDKRMKLLEKDINHALANHDRLVAENKRLRFALVEAGNTMSGALFKLNVPTMDNSNYDKAKKMLKDGAYKIAQLNSALSDTKEKE